MFIHEAILSRTLGKPCIRRRAWGYSTSSPVNAPVKIQPTDSPDGCVIISTSRKAPCCGWQPTAGDLMADDWEIVGL